MQELQNISTPAAIVDLTKMQRNVTRMHDHIRSLGGQMRPHLKTCKNINMARSVMQTPHGPATVSTLAEAAYFAANGVHDIMYAVGIVPQKLEKAAQIVQQGTSLCLVTDNMTSAKAIAAFACAQQCHFDVCLEIDCDGHRSGLLPDDPDLVALADVVSTPHSRCQGVMTHAGAAYACADVSCIRQLAVQEREAVVHAARILREHGYACPIVSVGSTPTALCAQDLTEVTEVRAGVYVFYDLVMAGLGLCTYNDIAFSVLSTVIGHQAAKGWHIIDAGWMALSQDRGTATQRIDQGYGIVCDMQGSPIGDLHVIETNQEHGIVASTGGACNVLLPVGTRVRILPNHACATAAAFTEYNVLDNSGHIHTWSRCTGW